MFSSYFVLENKRHFYVFTSHKCLSYIIPVKSLDHTHLTELMFCIMIKKKLA